MKNLLLPLLLLFGCLDYKLLQDDICPEHKTCSSNQECINGYCVDKYVPSQDMYSPYDFSIPPTTDMKTDMNSIDMSPSIDPKSDTCFKVNFSSYPFDGSSTSVRTVYPGPRLPPVQCISCSETNQSKCSGRMVMKKNCRTDATTFYWVDTTQQPEITYFSYSTAGTGTYELIVAYGKTVCERGIPSSCIFDYDTYYCDVVN